MTISVGNSVLLRYNDSEIIKVVITSCEKEQKKLEETGAWYVSEESPVGKNLKGRKQGDIFEIQVEGEKSKYEILGVEKNYFQNTSVAHTWVIFSQGKIVFKGSQEEAAIVFNQLEKIIPGMELKYIQQGVFPEDDFLKGLIFRTINEEEEEEKNRIYNIGRNTYRPRTLNALRRDHKKPHNPRKNVVKNLLTKSDSKNFSEACAEWAYEGDVLLEGEMSFEGQCEICKQIGLKTNYIIHHDKDPAKTFKVGSSCVTRFLKLNSSSSVDESNSIFLHLANLGMAAKKLRPLVTELGKDEIQEETLIKIITIIQSLSKYDKPSQRDIDRLDRADGNK